MRFIKTLTATLVLSIALAAYTEPTSQPSEKSTDLGTVQVTSPLDKSISNLSPGPR